MVNGQTAQPLATPNANPQGDWLLRFAPRPAAALRLFCFSYAGAGAATYRSWLDALPHTIELCAVQLPGRENRLREPPFTSIMRLVDAMVPALAPRMDRPFALFGHSMGALVAFELARRLQSLGTTRQPVRLLLSGRRAPHLPDTEPPMRGLAEAEFVAEIGRRYGGIPAEVLRHRELLELLLPGLRADIAAIETHTFEPGPALLCPLSVFGGDADPRATREQLGAWQQQTAAGMRLRLFPGEHFYLNAPAVRAELIGEVVRDLQHPFAHGAGGA